MVIVENLNINFILRKHVHTIIKDISFNIGQEKLALIGGSGAGKTLLAKSLLGLLPSQAIVVAKTLSVSGVNLITATNQQKRNLRGKLIAMVTQDPKFSLNPVLTVGSQIAESFMIHNNFSAKQAKTATLEMLATVKIHQPEQIYNKHSFELSGGMGQRVMIAMMLACQAKILIADEATSALDKQTKNEILFLLDELYIKHKMSLLMISHDLPMIKQFCDRAIILHNGNIIETCKASDIAYSNSPYVKQLWQCLPSLEKKGKKLSIAC